MSKFQVATLIQRDFWWFLTGNYVKKSSVQQYLRFNNDHEVEKLVSRQFSNFVRFFVKLDSFSKTKALCRFPKRILIWLKIFWNSETKLTCCNLTKSFFLQRFFNYLALVTTFFSNLYSKVELFSPLNSIFVSSKGKLIF